MFNKEYAQHYDFLNKEKDRKKEIEFIHKWAEIPRRILDLGCGTASYWKYFPGNNFIIGVEKSKDMIAHSPHKNSIFNLDVTSLGTLLAKQFHLATAMFNVINYIQNHDWWPTIPLNQGGYFIFDILSKEKAETEGFTKTVRKIGEVERTIKPLSKEGNEISLLIKVEQEGSLLSEEIHKLYLFSESDIAGFCGNEFEIVDVKQTKTWNTWFKLKRK